MSFTWKEYLERNYPKKAERANVKALELLEVYDRKVDLSDFTGLESFKLVMIPNTNSLYASRVSEVDVSKCVNLKELELLNNIVVSAEEASLKILETELDVALKKQAGVIERDYGETKQNVDNKVFELQRKVNNLKPLVPTFNTDINQFAGLTALKSLKLNGLPRREVHNSFLINWEVSKWKGSLQAFKDMVDLEELDIRYTKIDDDLECLNSHKLKSFLVSGDLKNMLQPYDFDVYAWKLIKFPDLMAVDATVWTKKMNSLINYEKRELTRLNDDWHQSRQPASFYLAFDPAKKTYEYINKPKKIVRLESKIALLESKLTEGFSTFLGAFSGGTAEKEEDKQPSWVKSKTLNG